MNLALSLMLGTAMGGGGLTTPTIVSGAVRARVNQSSANAFFGSAISTNPYNYTRARDKSAKTVTGARAIYSSVCINTSSTLPAAINNARQEQGVGSTQVLRGSIVTNLTGVAINQSGATTTVLTWADVANQSATGTTQGVDQFIYKLSAGAMVARTYAQMVTDGGAVASSTVNGSTVANTQITVPNGYVVISDAGPTLTAGSPYFVQLEERTVPQITATSITPSAGSLVFQCPATPDALLMVGDVGTISSATGNTTVNGTWEISAIDRVANTITMTGSTITAGAVTGTPVMRFTRPTGCYNANITNQNLGDYVKASATQQDFIGSGNWTGLGGNVAVDGTLMGGFFAILGTDATGSENVLVDGDSISAEVRDGFTNSPSATLYGDSDGCLAWSGRALNSLSVPSIRVAVPGMKAQTSDPTLKADDAFRVWAAKFCDILLSGIGHNDLIGAGTYATLKAYIKGFNDRRSANMRGRKKVVQITMTPTSAVGTSVNWSTAPRSLQTLSGNFAYPAGMVYANFNPDVAAKTVGNTGVIDLAAFSGNLDGTATVDGYWPVDGTTYKYTTDGTHPSKDGHTGLAAQVTSGVWAAAIA